jgi:hypothetical protein
MIMKNILVALAIVVMPIGASCLMTAPTYAAVTVSELGDLSPLRAIVTDTLDLATKGSMANATKRITDYETAWDADAKRLDALNHAKWAVIDDASDAAITALRTNPPVTADVISTLNALIATLDNPTLPTKVADATATTDANGRPLPCEDLLASVRSASAATPPAAADKAKFDDLQNKGIERCNADDDKRADDFFGQALGLIGK